MVRSAFKSPAKSVVLSAAFASLVFALGLAAPSHAATFFIDGPGKLTTLSGNASFTSGGPTHRVRFAPGGYSDPGTLTLASALTADTLLFERSASDTSVVQITGSLLTFKNLTSTTVLLRGLAFRLGVDGKLLEGQVGGSPNHNLILDSCVILADSLNTTFLSWLGGTGSKVEIRRSMLVVGNNGPNVKIDFQADSVSLQNNLLNFEGVAAINSIQRLLLQNNTANKTQFNLNTDGTATYFIHSNLFAHAPSQNRLLVGGASRFCGRLSGAFEVAGSSILDNARFDTWSGFDFPLTSTYFSDVSNTTVTPATYAPGKSDSTLWDWRIASDVEHGAWNGSLPLAAHNVFPKQTTLAVRLGNASGKDSVELTLSPAAIPRAVGVAYGNAAYPSFTDSTRTLWLKDTTLAVTGVVRVTSLTFPKRASEGRPMLFGRATSNFVPGFVGAASGLIFTNSDSAAKNFIPAWAGQDTKKGRRVLVTGRAPDTAAAVVYDSISRTGITALAMASLSSVSKRQRVLTKQSATAGLAFSTNAEGMDSIGIGIGKAGLTSILADSVAFLIGSGSDKKLKAVRDSGGKYWTKMGFAASGEVVLIENLGIGSGKDTLPFTFGAVITNSAKGHQITLDSSFRFDTTLSSPLANATRGLRLRWPGRASGDNLQVTLKRTSANGANKTLPPQMPFAWVGDSAISLTAAASDSESVTVSLGLGDTLYPIFLASAFPVPSLKSVNLKRGVDSLLGIHSQTPGDITLDSLATPHPDFGDTLHFLAGRSVVTSNLRLLDSYTVVLPLKPDTAKNLRAFAQSDTVWSKIDITFASGFGRVILDKQAKGFAIFEFKLKADTTTPPDTIKPDTVVKVKSIASTPDTLFLIEGGAPGAVTTTFTPDSSAQALGYRILDTNIAVLKTGSQGYTRQVSGLKAGRTKLVVWVEKQAAITDTVWLEVRSPDRPDTLAVTPAKEPDLRLEGDSLQVKPQLHDSEVVKLANYVVTVKTLNVDGIVTDISSEPIAPTDGYAIPRIPGTIQVVEVTYESVTGRKSVSSPLYADLNTVEITTAMNAKAPSLPGKVWNLVGFPKGGSVQRDIAAKATKTPDFLIWEGSWKKPTTDTLLPGTSILYLSDSAFIPQVSGSPAWDLNSVVVSLKQGWNLVSSPLPFAIPEAALGFDPKIVGWFYGLSWSREDSKPNSQPKFVWSQLDTLKPFQGFAVWSESASQLVFNPKALFQANPKKASAADGFKITLASPSVGRYTLWMHNGKALRQSPRLAFGVADPGIEWNAPVNVKGYSGLRFIRVVSTAQDRLRLEQPLPAGMELASVLPLESKPTFLDPMQSANLSAGDNWFVLGPKNLVQSFRNSAWVNPNMGPFSVAGQQLKGFLPFQYGVFSSLQIRRYRLDGTELENVRFQDLRPGLVSIPMKPLMGMTFLRLEFQTSLRGKVSQSLMVPGGMNR